MAINTHSKRILKEERAGKRKPKGGFDIQLMVKFNFEGRN